MPMIKPRTFNLEGKLNAQWSRTLGVMGRLRVQNQLNCCGYFSPFVEATVSQTCYARSLLPGCKGPYIRFEKLVLAHPPICKSNAVAGSLSSQTMKSVRVEAEGSG